MLTTAEIQQAHELAVIQDGLDAHNLRFNLSLKVVSQPDPPDAMLSDGSITTWMEVTDAFYSTEYARHLSTHNSIKGHKPMAKGLRGDVDEDVAVEFCNALAKKVGKTSYIPLIQKYGPGILVIGVETPWYNEFTLEAIDQEWVRRGRPDFSATFSHVYLRVRGSHTIAWPRR